KMKTDIQKELIDSANQIREKYRALKRGQYLQSEERFQAFQPLIEPLQELKEIASKNNSERQLVQITRPPYVPTTPSKIPIQAPVTPLKLDFGLLASQYLGNYLNKKAITDTTYGIRRDGNKFFIGDKEIEIANDDITIGDKIYKGTKGLWELLTLKEPIDYSDDDLNTYKKILESTNG